MMQGGLNSGIRGPVSGATAANGGVDGGLGVICLSLTTSPALFQIPSAFIGQLCRVVSVGGYTQLLQGNANVAVVANQASGVSSSVITIDKATGDHFPDGVPDRLEFDMSATHFSAVGSASLKLFIRVVSPR